MAGTGGAHLRTQSLLRVEDLVVEFAGPAGRRVHAVSGISFCIMTRVSPGVVVTLQ